MPAIRRSYVVLGLALLGGIAGYFAWVSLGDPCAAQQERYARARPEWEHYGKREEFFSAYRELQRCRGKADADIERDIRTFGQIR